MSSRPLVIAGIVGGIVAGIALFAAALALVAAGGTSLGGPMMAMLVLGTIMGFVLDSAWLCVAIGLLAKLDGGDGNEGEDGGRGPAPGPIQPGQPSGDPEWWPEFERDFRVYLEEHQAQPSTSQPCSP